MRTVLNNARGAALMTVLIATMIITILLLEFQYASMLEKRLAYNDLHQTQAYYLAKSGIYMGLLRVTLFARLNNDSSLKSLVQGTGKDIRTYLDQVWKLPLPAFPPPAALVKQMVKSDQNSAEKTLAQTRISDGETTHTIVGESGKINLNLLMVPPDKRDERPNFFDPPQRIDQMIAQMLFNLVEGFLKASNNPYQEYQNLRPEELVMDIMDWVNPGDVRFFGGFKDAYYERLNPPYKSKKAPFYTIEELKLVRGVDDHLYNKLKPNVTVYSQVGSINLNTASSAVIRSIYPEFTDDDLKRISTQRDDMGGWPSEAVFVDFVVNNLNRPGFKSRYPPGSSLPFSVGTECFEIESVGRLRRSASSIQRTINVSVSFSSAPGGGIIPGIGTAADCNKNPSIRFWDPRSGNCRANPRGEGDCTNVLAGTWLKQNNEFVCKINTTTGTGQGPPLYIKAGKQGKDSGAGALKILRWAEG